MSEAFQNTVNKNKLVSEVNRKAVGVDYGGPALMVGRMLLLGYREQTPPSSWPNSWAGKPFQGNESELWGASHLTATGAGLAGTMSQGFRGPTGKPAGSAPSYLARVV